MEIKSIITDCNSWTDFSSRLENLTKKEKGDAFELLTKLYFKLSPQYDFYEDVWFLSETPSKVLEEIGLPNHDIGIDLIAKNGSEYHAIQCKYHSDRNKSVTFKEVATFISLLESNQKLSQGYICSTADITSRNFQKLKTKPINLIFSDTWEGLGQDFFDRAKSFFNKQKIDLKPFEPREHQKKAIKEAINYFDKEDNSRGKLIFPCGAGKSLTGFWMTQELKSNSTLIAVPSLSLVKQTLEVYLREVVARNKKVKWLCICSDEGIGKNDDVVFYTENIGVPCQTDPVYIEKWLRENVNQEIIIFTTYQSGKLIAEISKKINFTFDVGVFDEAHKTVGSDKKMFSHLLFDENINIQKRIFMTATERFYKGSKDDILSMDDEDVYGDTFAKMSFKEAIEEGLLTDYKVITIDIQKSEIAQFIKDNNLVQLNNKWSKETEARSLASMLALRKAMRHFPIKNAVSFHSSIEKANRNKELQDYISEYLNFEPIDSFTVSGKQQTTKRNAIVNEFAQSNKALITNSRCLTEGVDVPNIDCIVFSDPRKSKVDIVQALGRALRKKEGKEWGYVILPVIYDDETHEIDNENFNEILAVVRGLASNDERIIEYFKDKSNENELSKKSDNQFHFDVFSDYLNEKELSEQLKIKLWDNLSRFNWMPFEEAREYVRSLNLQSQKDWKIFKTKNSSLNIPLNCSRTYEKEWISWGDWLGTGYVSYKYRNYMSFEEAKSYIKKFNIKSTSEYVEKWKNGLLSNQIPLKPREVYKNKGFVSMPDFLGYESIFQDWVSYDDAKKYLKKFEIKSESEYKKLWGKNKFEIKIPKNPRSVYKNKGFVSMPDFLGYESIFQVWKSWSETIKIIHPLKLRTAKEFRNYIKNNPIKGVHSSPESYFKSIWLEKGGWSAFLGKKISNLEKSSHRLPFIEAREYVWSLKFKTGDDWKAFTKNNNFPIFLPKAPQIVYDEWISIEDWLGPSYLKRNERIGLKYYDFFQARKIVREKKFNNWDEFLNWGNRPEKIPSNPERVYDEFKGRRDWLGLKSYFANKKGYLGYDEAKAIVKKMGITSASSFRKFKKQSNFPSNIPLTPEKFYKSEWAERGGWGGFLGTGNTSTIKIEYLSFSEAKKIVGQLGLKSKNEWFEFAKSNNKPKNIPSAVNSVYKSEWKGWADFLGK